MFERNIAAFNTLFYNVSLPFRDSHSEFFNVRGDKTKETHETQRNGTPQENNLFNVISIPKSYSQVA